MGGNFFKIDRAIFDHQIWQDPVQFRIFFYLVGKAVFAKEGLMKGNVHIKRGHYLISYRRIRDELEYIENNAVKKYPLSRIHRAIEKLEGSEMLKKHETELGTLFEVVNYEKYQGYLETESDAWNGSGNEDGTQMEQQKNNNKNVKNEKNLNKIQQGEETGENPFVMYQQYFGKFPSSMIIEDINFYLDSGMDQKLVSYSFYKAARNGEKFNYSRGILNRWHDKGIRIYEDALKEEEQFKQRKVKKINEVKTDEGSQSSYETDYSRYNFRSSNNL
jgi:DnaD/phage-associated family protein